MCFIRLNRIIVIITRRAQERTAMNTEGSNRIIEDSKNGVTLVTRSERTKVVVQVARELGPMGTANGASDTTMADIGRDAGKMECVRALSSEYSLAWTAALALVTQRI